MTILMVTPFAPYRDGIAAYAVQELRALWGQGQDVEVLSPLPSAAHHHLGLGGVRGIAALASRARGYDRVIIQFAPEMMFGACHGPIERVMVWAGLCAMAKLTRLELRVHEIEHGPIQRNWGERRAAAEAFRRADVVSVHTESERDDLVNLVGIQAAQINVVGHGAAFVAATDVTRQQARADLGLGDKHVFLSIGFVQHHKGFDRGVAAFGAGRLGQDAEIHIVGSVRVDDPELIAYASSLEGMCRQTPGAEFHRGFVSDELFDRWILAADTVLLPYREIWSSGVLERANLLGTPVLAADVGGLAHQIKHGSYLFGNDDEMASLMCERVAKTEHDFGSSNHAIRTDLAVGEQWGVGTGTTRDLVQAEVSARAGNKAGLAQPSSGVVIDPLVRLGRFERPRPVSARRGVGTVKRFIGRTIGWEIDALARHVDDLQTATVEALTASEANRHQTSTD